MRKMKTIASIVAAGERSESMTEKLVEKMHREEDQCRASLTDRQKLVLSEFSRHGGLLVPGDDEVKSRCQELTALKLLRPQPILDGNKPCGDHTAISIAYQVTAKGRKLAQPTTHC